MSRTKPIIPDRSLPLEQYPPVFGAVQAARYLNCSPNHLIKLCKAGVLSAFNCCSPGSSQSYYRIPRNSLAAFLQARAA
jgi:hypothetical protein